MLYGILATLFCILGLFITLVVMFQKSHGGFWWTGSSASEASSVFGGSGGADVLQKITWVCGFLLIIGAFSLTIYRARIAKVGRYSQIVTKTTPVATSNHEDSSSSNETIEPESSSKE